MLHRSITPRLIAAMLVACACDPAATEVRPDGGLADAGALPPPRASRSSSLAISRDGRYRVAVNPDLPGLIVEANGVRVTPGFFGAGSRPSSVALHPAKDTAFVTVRQPGELVRVDDLLGSARSDVRIAVCSEPTGVALSPSGRLAVVACFGEPLAVIVDTETNQKQLVPLAGVARAVAITNDGDSDDLDEHAYVTLFYGSPVLEGSDVGRVGKVAEIDLRQKLVTATLALNPISDTGFGPPIADGGEGPHVACSPNQLAAIAIAARRAWVTYTCVSPQPPLNKLTTLFSAVSELDLTGRRETRAVSLAQLVRRQGAATDSVLGLTVDLDVDSAGTLAVVLSQAANRVALLTVAADVPIQVVPTAAGTTSTLVPHPADPGGTGGSGPCGYAGCGGPADANTAAGVPIAVALGEDGAIAVNDWTGHALLDVTPKPRALIYEPGPPAGSREAALLVGRRFFYTGQDRWSFRDVGSCASCHPDGLSDNVTWMFGAGPRQTPSLDGTFAKNDPNDHRAQNWTAIFDEIYDVEGVTRGLLGGKGAICSGRPPMDVPIPLGLGLAFDPGAVFSRNDNLSGSAKWVVDQYSSIGDWRELELFIQGIHANRAPHGVDRVAAQRGRDVFASAGCAACHGGPKWTVSRVPYAPSPFVNGSLPGDNGGPPYAASGLRSELREQQLPAYNRDLFKVAPERLPNPDGGAMITVGPERITCALRDVGTFDPADALEKKTDGTRAQGAMGFNPPSLLGLATSAPYLHSGAARSLSDVFAPRFAAHARVSPQELPDLIEFLRSIDESTPPFPSSMTVDICGGY